MVSESPIRFSPWMATTPRRSGRGSLGLGRRAFASCRRGEGSAAGPPWPGPDGMREGFPKVAQPQSARVPCGRLMRGGGGSRGRPASTPGLASRPDLSFRPGTQEPPPAPPQAPGEAGSGARCHGAESAWRCGPGLSSRWLWSGPLGGASGGIVRVVRVGAVRAGVSPGFEVSPRGTPQQHRSPAVAGRYPVTTPSAAAVGGAVQAARCGRGICLVCRRSRAGCRAMRAARLWSPFES